MTRWQRPQSREILTNALDSELERAQGKKVLIDLGRCWPGDLIAENFIENDLPQAKWLILTISELCQRRNHKLVFRFTDSKSSQGFQREFQNEVQASSWSIEEDVASLSFADAKGTRAPDRDHLVWSIHDLVCLVEFGLFARHLFEDKEAAINLPLCLWGDVQALGHHWVNTAQTLAEVFEMTGQAGPRPQFVLINGPLGELASWSHIKNESLSSLSASLNPDSHSVIGGSIRSLHFFSSKERGVIQRVWNELFREDQCFQCLPCRFAREQMTEEREVDIFKGSAAYQCHLPMLYRKFKGFKEVMALDVSKEKATRDLYQGSPS